MDAAAALDTDVTKKKRVAPSEADIASRLRTWRESGDIHITAEYEEAFRAIFQTLSNVLLTGGAGVGKTTFLKSVVIPEMNRRGIRYAVTAMTGIAGSHLSGRTIHSWLGIGLGPEFPPGVSPLRLSEVEVEQVFANTYDKWLNGSRGKGAVDGVKRRLKSTEVVILDEVSMCHGTALLDYMNYFMRATRGVDEPFGGIQMIFAGDFAQLPPVEKWAGNRPDWAFLSKSWVDARVHPIEFTEVFRQSDVEFSNFLNRRRTGQEMTPEERVYAAQFVRKPSAEESVRATFLVPTNKQADLINEAVLPHYPEPEWQIPMVFDIRPHHHTQWDDASKIRQRLIGSSILRETLYLRAGLPVLLTLNDPDGRYVNGSKAFVREFKLVPSVPAGETNDAMLGAPEPNNAMPSAVPGMVEQLSVTLADSNKTQLTFVRVTKCLSAHDDPYEMVRITDDKGEATWQPKSARLAQFPVIPGTAITIHKCVDKSTLLPTTKGMREIGDICSSCEGVLVAGITAYNPASEPFVGVRELGYRIVTRRGYSLLCSERHPLLRISDRGEEWIKSPDLRVGDTLRMRGGTMSFGDGAIAPYARPTAHHNANDYKLPTEMTDDLAWALGAMAGDGCGADKRDGRFDVTSMDDEVVAEYVRIVNQTFGVSTTVAPRADSVSTRNVYSHNWGVRNFLLHLGFTHDKAPLKRVPAVIWSGGRTHHAAFLRGYFDTDGGVNSCVHVTSTSRGLIGDVHLMLLNMGIVSTIAFMPRENPKHSDAWRINITGVDVVKYRDLVGFTIARKRTALEGLRATHRVIPKAQCGEFPKGYEQVIAQALRKELTTVYPGRRAGQLGFGTHQAWARWLSRVASPSGKASITDAHLAAMLRDLPLCASAGPVSSAVFGEAAAGCFNDEIVGIERETGDMRDIAVPNGHAFVGNGFVNHNCQGMSLDDCVVDLNRSFAPGQVYVAMSRLRKPEGLTLITDKFETMVDPHVLAFYGELRKRRQEASVELDLPVIEDQDPASYEHQEY